MTTLKPVDAAEGGFHSQFFERLTTYSLVDYAYKTAQSCYTRVKSSSKYAEYGLDTAEYFTSLATKTAEPLLSKVDEFGFNQLVKAEETLSVPYQKVTQFPLALLDKTLAFGEDSLDYWLPVDHSNEEEEEEESKKDTELTYSHLGVRATHVLETFQVRAKDKLYSYPVVAKPAELAKATLREVKTLSDKARSVPSAVSHYYSERKNAIVSRISAYHSSLTRTLSSVTDRVFEFLYSVKHQYDTLRSSTRQELGIRFVNNLHKVTEYLYERLYPTELVASLRKRIQTLLQHLVPLRSRTQVVVPTENGNHDEPKKERKQRKKKRGDN